MDVFVTTSGGVGVSSHDDAGRRIKCTEMKRDGVEGA
jgi:hypothetical protein